jgi:hypothetical protein
MSKMHPNAYLKSYWRKEYKNQVFVAMSFAERFDRRFEDVIKPAIEGAPINGLNLKAYRVDISKSGDSILSEIADGIAHSYLVLADVSTIDVGKYSDKPIRNSNVLYEVGIALACRSPEEVLLVRDDKDSMLFDTSTIPHLQVDFSLEDEARRKLYDALSDRARERDISKDARVQIALTRLTPDDLAILQRLSNLQPGKSMDLRYSDQEGQKALSIPTQAALTNLLREELVGAHSITNDGTLTYIATDFGKAVITLFRELSSKLADN